MARGVFDGRGDMIHVDREGDHVSVGLPESGAMSPIVMSIELPVERARQLVDAILRTIYEIERDGTEL